VRKVRKVRSVGKKGEVCEMGMRRGVDNLRAWGWEWELYGLAGTGGEGRHEGRGVNGEGDGEGLSIVMDGVGRGDGNVDDG
jgi:hypothetical protein